jgi:outer membrane protein OmpA-like peptidoglycan-associated protein
MRQGLIGSVGGLLVLALCGCGHGGDAASKAPTARAAAPARATHEATAAPLPTLEQMAAQPQPTPAMPEVSPLVQTFAPGQVTLASPRLSVHIEQVTYATYGITIEGTAQQHVRVSGGGLYLNFSDRGALRDDAGNTYRLRDPDLDLQTRAAARDARWKLRLVAHGFLPANAHRLDLGLNMTTSARDALVHAAWEVPAAWATRLHGSAQDMVEPGRGWRFGTPPTGNSPGGTGSMRIYEVHWLADGIALTVEAINSHRSSRLEFNSGPWSTRLVDDRGRVYRIVQSDSGQRSLGIDNGQRAVGRLLFAPQIAPDARRLRLLINGGPKGADPWAPITAADDNGLAPRLGIAFDIPPAAMPGLPAATKQTLSLTIAQAPWRSTPLPVSRIDPIARLKRELGATEHARSTVVDLPGDVLFDFDRASLRADAQPTLDKLAELLTRLRQPAHVAGHTDDLGDPAYNRQLSLDRARTVRDALVRRGVDAASLDVAGYGEAQPKVPNRHADGSDDPAGRRQNRRVEVVIDKR